MSASEGWFTSTLAEVVAPDFPIGYGIVQPGPHVGAGIPMIAVRDLLDVAPERLHRVAAPIEANYRRSRVSPRDVLISVKGTTGRIGIVPPGLRANISRDVARLRLRADQVPEFWFQLLRSEGAQRVLEQAAVGTTRQELSIGTLRQLSFEYPSRAEQQLIAEILGDQDRLIQSMESLLSKKRMVKQGLMQAVLSGRKRLPGFDIPWVSTRIGDAANIVKGQQLGRAAMLDRGTVPVWNGGVEPSGHTDKSNVRHMVVTVSEGGNSCGWIGRPPTGFWLGGHCYALTPTRPGLTVDFLYQVLKAREPEVMALRVGSGLPNIQKKALSNFTIRIPKDAAEADMIGIALGDADREIDALERRLQASRLMKHGMMHELIAGRTRLKTMEFAA